ncbi:DotD/TraH family lipoprotein [Ralstonia pickettii]|uniref:DotD/TraH family lipoprotein n=1 Tax=Ralstonia pickettii TaxID=329 RepID=UPI000AF49FD0|nr:DotD/TraH family lipoprotein [Ralstonia pickettii]
MRLQAVSSLLMTVLISGCASSQLNGSGTNEQDPAYQALMKSARNIEQSLSLLSEAEQFEKMRQNPNQPRIFKQIAGMEQVVTMPWQGTLEQAVSKLSAYSGFEVKFMGRPPATPILVQIGRDPATVSDHMRNLGIQAGSRADVVVDPAQKIVEVRYGNGGV